MERFENTRQPDWDWWGRLWPTPGETLRDLGLSSGDTVAEAGAGNGYFALPAARIVDPAPVYAIDLDDAILEELIELARLQGIDTIDPIHADVRELSSCLPEPVDVVLIANTFHGVDDPAGPLREAFDSLRPDGRLVIVNWHDRPREETVLEGTPRGPPTEKRLSPADTREVVAGAAEFTLEREVDLPPYHYGLVFERV